MSIASVITRGYGAFGDIPAIVLLGYAPGGIAPAQSAGPGDGDESSRRRWLEWREEKFRKRREAPPPQPARVPARVVRIHEPVAAPIPFLDLSPAVRLLSANIQAMRDQADALRAAERALLDDDEEAMALLLEEL